MGQESIEAGCVTLRRSAALVKSRLPTTAKKPEVAAESIAAVHRTYERPVFSGEGHGS
jgi:hypothetical protein